MGMLKRYPAISMGLGITFLFWVFGIVRHAAQVVLNEKPTMEPSWGASAELMTILALGLVITFVLPRINALMSLIVVGMLLIFLLGFSIYCFIFKSLRVQVTYPLLQLIIGCFGVLSIRYPLTEMTLRKSKRDSEETDRHLGITYQSQGLLEMAFEKFRRLTMNDETKELLYNLGLDFERKKQVDQAAAVYAHLEKFDSEFRDIHERMNSVIRTGSTMDVSGEACFGPLSKGKLILPEDDHMPFSLGRYEITRVLGKGAMGTVYLGLDPRILRKTAIKAFRIGEDLHPEDREHLKEKFFREAKSAGTLSHPNIVTIFDAGEEQDLAYIAMEYLEGNDFTQYTNKKELLPARKVIDYVADIANALDYAHQAGIVHRDIKPANIMLLKNGIPKVTDFGIARIAATSKTQMGVVKGTPYYMSPEQISGEQVDGRSDLFSLGVMLFQLLTGELPFRGESPAALMNQIMNVHHPDPRKFNPKIVKPLLGILSKSLEKDRTQRYQRGVHMERHLREIGKRMDVAASKKKREAPA